jgi:hypothetical protein
MWLRVTNLPADTTQAELVGLFAGFGTVATARAWPESDRDGRRVWSGIVALDPHGHNADDWMDRIQLGGQRVTVVRVYPNPPPPEHR